MSRWTKFGLKGGTAFGAVSLAAMMLAPGATAGEMVPVISGDTVTVQMTKEQYELLMNVLPRVQQLERQVQDNSQNLVLQQGQTQATNERLDQVVDEIPDQGTLVNSGKRGVTLELSGQVDVGVMYADTGSGPSVGMIAPDAGREVWIVDNDNSSTRFRLVANAPIGDDWEVGGLIEMELQKNDSDCVNQTDDSADNCDFELSGGALRKAEAIVHNKHYGKARLGQGDTASNGISEQDLSGTFVIGYSSVADVGGSLIWRDTGTGALNGAMYDIDNFFNNLDGLSRQERVRYDTPSFYGTSVAASYIDGGAYDVRLQHSYQWPVLGGTKVAAAVGWYDGTDIGDPEGVSGSISILHVPTGLNITGAGGAVTQPEPGDTQEPSFYYVKGGWQHMFFDIGKTAMSVDAYWGFDFEFDGTKSNSYGIQLVQNLDKTSTEFFIGGRVFMVDNVPGEDFQDIYTLLSGVRQKF